MLEINKLYNVDCLSENGLLKIDDNSIDCIICDLPYNITKNKWDKNIFPLNSYLFFQNKMYYKNDFFLFMFDNTFSKEYAEKYWNENKKLGLWDHYERIIKENGAIILFGSGLFTMKLMESNKENWRYNIIWQKTLPTGFQNANKMPMKAHEDICIFYKKLPIYNPQKTSGHTRKVSKAEHKTNCKKSTNYNDYKYVSYDSTERFPTTIWTFAKDTQKSAIHPTQKPIKLIEELIKTYSNENDIILDNCAGSCTTAIAAINTNRNYICMEKDEEIYIKALNRIDNIKN